MIANNETSTGFGTHGDYMFGWKGDSLQRAMDSACYVNCPTLKTQSVSAMNKCKFNEVFVDEPVDGCKFAKESSGCEMTPADTSDLS